MKLISKARLILRRREEFIEDMVGGKKINISSHELARGILALSELVKPAEVTRTETTIISLYKMSMPHIDDHTIELAVRRIPALFGESLESVSNLRGIANAFAMINSAIISVNQDDYQS